MSQTNRNAAVHSLLAAAPFVAVLLTGGRAAAQTIYACYVPPSGTVYRIKEPGLPTQCGSSTKKGVTIQHVEFSWSPTGGVSDHGSLTGLADDDHPQYLLADGARSALDGFAVTGTLNSGGSIPASGPGTRLMWYPKKAALRAGYVNSTQWDDASIGQFSIGLGSPARASGVASVAIGVASASGDGAVALGAGTATGPSSFAVNGSAQSFASIAIGNNAIADGEASVALGTFANVNGKHGAIVIGDGSTYDFVSAAADNQFVARASQFWLGSTNSVTATAGRFIETSTGAWLSTGGTWTNSSDVNRKTDFENIETDDVLDAVAAMPISKWSYRDEDSSVRHIGPTAQDFRAAFQLGASETSIATVDADGVALASIQALERRTAELKRENESLRAELLALTARLERVEQKHR